MVDEQLDDWLEVLAGRQSAPEHSSAARLRKIVLEQERRLEENIRANHPTDELALEELRYRIRQRQSHRKPMWRRNLLPLALAASLILVTTAVFFTARRPQVSLTTHVSPPSVTAPPAVEAHVIEARFQNPVQAARALQNELRQAGIQANLESTADGCSLTFTYPGPAPVAIGKNLISGGISLAPGPNRIHIAAMQ